MADLFEPITVRGTTFRNRVWVSPMCQYSAAADAVPHSWHLVHLGQFAIGGAGLVMTEATSVAPEGRLSPADTGLWSDEQGQAWAPIVDFVKRAGALIGVQLVHAGRKASTTPPWEGMTYVPPAHGGWATVGPSAVPFGTLPTPQSLNLDELDTIVEQFRSSALRALEVGFDVIELHAAHGYLLHQFLSPLANNRQDEYGGPLENRARLLVRVVDAVREVWPLDRPLFVRLSTTDWMPGGWTVEDSVSLARTLRDHHVDLIDCSSGGAVPNAEIPHDTDYQIPAARAIRDGAGVLTGAVGRITDPVQAEAILREGHADVLFIGRAMLRNPHWALEAAFELGHDIAWPQQYAEAKPRLSALSV